jgi:methyl coenzyme M reductase subunit C
MELSPTSLQAIARHTRAMLRSVKRRPKTAVELAYALAAAKIVVATLAKAAADAGIPAEAIAVGDELAADAARVMDLVRWR